jgi:hypothetical protein
MKRSPGPIRRGYTLLELTVSLLAASFLMVGMGASIHLAARASDPSLGSFQTAQESVDGLAALQRELAFATRIDEAERTVRGIGFTIPDITGDGVEDALRYEWSGVAGDPLRRILNGNSADILPAVRDFRLAYHTRKVEAATPNSSGEQRWVDQKSIGATSGARSLAVGDGIGIWFRPSLPAAATASGVSQIEINARRAFLPRGGLTAQVTRADSSKKPAGVLKEEFVAAAALPSSMSSHQVTFSRGMELTPSEGACVTLVCNSGLWSVADIRTGRDRTSAVSTTTMTTSNGGSNWSETALEDLRISVWGTYSTTAGGGIDTWSYVSVDASLTPDSPGARSAHAGILLLNSPEAAGP